MKYSLECPSRQQSANAFLAFAGSFIFVAGIAAQVLGHPHGVLLFWDWCAQALPRPFRYRLWFGIYPLSTLSGEDGGFHPTVLAELFEFTGGRLEFTLALMLFCPNRCNAWLADGLRSSFTRASSLAASTTDSRLALSVQLATAGLVVAAEASSVLLSSAMARTIPVSHTRRATFA